jgi:hypothetical protein
MSAVRARKHSVKGNITDSKQSTAVRYLRGILLLLACSACAEKTAYSVQLVKSSLIDQTMWRKYPASEDPLASHQPSEINCGPGGFYVELGLLEVDTNFCNYLLAQHPARIAIAAGTEVSLDLSHYDLNAAEPATAHAALLFGDTLVWETSLDIPGRADVLHATFRTPRALAVGEAIRMHLHNHGQNNYAVGPIEASIPCDRDCLRDQ